MVHERAHQSPKSDWRPPEHYRGKPIGMGQPRVNSLNISGQWQRVFQLNKFHFLNSNINLRPGQGEYSIASAPKSLPVEPISFSKFSWKSSSEQ